MGPVCKLLIINHLLRLIFNKTAKEFMGSVDGMARAGKCMRAGAGLNLRIFI